MVQAPVGKYSTPNQNEQLPSLQVFGYEHATDQEAVEASHGAITLTRVGINFGSYSRMYGGGSTHLIGFPAVSDMACVGVSGEAVSGGKERGRRP